MLKEWLIGVRDNRELRKAEEVLGQIQEGQESFAIWGAGHTGLYAKRFFDENSGGKLTPYCILDNNPSLWGTDNIISPEDFFSLKVPPEHVIVAVYAADQVVSQLRDNGYRGTVSCLNLAAVYSAEDVWNTYEEHMGELELLYQMLEDQKSQDTLIGFLNYLRSLDSEYLTSINGDIRDKLVDASILQPSAAENFLDVGAFTGDTIREFLSITEGRYEQIVALEPEEHNYTALEEYVREQKLWNVTLIKAAAGQKDCTMRFRANVSESSVISETGNEEVTVRRIDGIAKAQKASWLKVSANGFELDILMGAEKLILQRTPKISAYVSCSLLWELPMYLKRVNPDYKIYLRHYGTGKQAMACYAIPGAGK